MSVEEIIGLFGCTWIGIGIVKVMLSDAKDIAHDKALARAAVQMGLQVRGIPRARRFSGARDGGEFKIEQLRSPALVRRGVAQDEFHSYRGRVRAHGAVDWFEVYRPIRLGADNLETEIAALLRRAQARA